MKKGKLSIKGFTLLEMLVVVLIIGILAGIALPQYQMAVTKAKVASIIPIMRRFKDAMTEYKLRNNGSCFTEDDAYPNGSDLGVNWPSDWKDTSSNPCKDSYSCENDFWLCFVNGNFDVGEVGCATDNFIIYMFQSDGLDEEDLVLSGKTACYAMTEEGHKVCKALGGKLLSGYSHDNYYTI